MKFYFDCILLLSVYRKMIMFEFKINYYNFNHLSIFNELFFLFKLKCLSFIFSDLINLNDDKIEIN